MSKSLEESIVLVDSTKLKVGLLICTKRLNKYSNLLKKSFVVLDVVDVCGRTDITFLIIEISDSIEHGCRISKSNYYGTIPFICDGEENITVISY